MENKEKLTCEECEVKFKTEALFEEHKSKTHGEEESENQVPNDVEIREMFQNSVLIFCNLCQQNIELDQFSTHEDLHYNYNQDRENFSEAWNGCSSEKITEIELKELSHLCLHCKQRFPSSAALMEHLGKTDDGTFSEIFGCVFCSLHFNTKNQLLKHHGLHFDSGLNNLSVCNVCQKSFVSFDFLVHHKITSHLAENVLPKCGQCKETFLSLSCVDCHQAVSEHCYQEKKFICVTCSDLTFLHPYDLEKHNVEHHKTMNKLVPAKIVESPNKSLLKLPPSSKMKGYTPSKSEVDLNYCCYLCSSRFSSSKGLIDHLNWAVVNQEMLLNCGICNNYFENMATLSEHKSIMHRNGVEEFHCDFCRAVFCEKSLLDQHIVRKHTAPKITCVECGLKFATKQELTCHVMKSYLCQFTDDMSCQVCEINFIYRSSFRAHYLFDHKNKGRFMCACQKSFKNVGLLDYHKRALICKKCEACFCENLWKQHKLKDCNVPKMPAVKRKRPRIVDDSDDESLADLIKKNKCSKSDTSMDVSKDSVKSPNSSGIQAKSEIIVYACVVCKKAFRTKDFLKKHITNKHPDYKKEKEETTEEN